MQDKFIEQITVEMEGEHLRQWRGAEYDLEEGRKVSWFSAKAKRELSALIWFINRCALRPQELDLVAGILSATAREVSYCRNDQWKIHRMPPAERSGLQEISLHRVFETPETCDR